MPYTVVFSFSFIAKVLKSAEDQLATVDLEDEACEKQKYANQPFTIGHQLLLRWITSLRSPDLGADRCCPVLFGLKNATCLYCSFSLWFSDVAFFEHCIDGASVLQ